MTLTVDGATREVRPLLIAFANARQYGNGALIAPQARVDDGRLDVVVVDDRPLLGIIRRVPALFRGSWPACRACRWRRRRGAGDARGPIRYHVDGEPCEATGTLTRHGARRRA
jgi:diacylglycerol kinase family enzyme